jgi:hypothetical protein
MNCCDAFGNCDQGRDCPVRNGSTSTLLTNEHKVYLEALRDSGETNMWGAAPYIQSAFRVSHADSKKILVEWIESFK